jgi:hypothetical protein
MGFRRPRFHRDAPRWFTLLMFGICVAIILAWVVLGRR